MTQPHKQIIRRGIKMPAPRGAAPRMLLVLSAISATASSNVHSPARDACMQHAAWPCDHLPSSWRPEPCPSRRRTHSCARPPAVCARSRRCAAARPRLPSWWRAAAPTPQARRWYEPQYAVRIAKSRDGSSSTEQPPRVRDRVEWSSELDGLWVVATHN